MQQGRGSIGEIRVGIDSKDDRQRRQCQRPCKLSPDLHRYISLIVCEISMLSRAQTPYQPSLSAAATSTVVVEIIPTQLPMGSPC